MLSLKGQIDKSTTNSVLNRETNKTQKTDLLTAVEREPHEESSMR